MKVWEHRKPEPVLVSVAVARHTAAGGLLPQDSPSLIPTLSRTPLGRDPALKAAQQHKPGRQRQTPNSDTGFAVLESTCELSGSRAASPPALSLARGCPRERGSACPTPRRECAQVGKTRLHPVDDALLPRASTALRL